MTKEHWKLVLITETIHAHTNERIEKKGVNCEAQIRLAFMSVSIIRHNKKTWRNIHDNMPRPNQTNHNQHPHLPQKTKAYNAVLNVHTHSRCKPHHSKWSMAALPNKTLDTHNTPNHRMIWISKCENHWRRQTPSFQIEYFCTVIHTHESTHPP